MIVACTGNDRKHNLRPLFILFHYLSLEFNLFSEKRVSTIRTNRYHSRPQFIGRSESDRLSVERHF